MPTTTLIPSAAVQEHPRVWEPAKLLTPNLEGALFYADRATASAQGAVYGFPAQPAIPADALVLGIRVRLSAKASAPDPALNHPWNLVGVDGPPVVPQETVPASPIADLLPGSSQTAASLYCRLADGGTTSGSTDFSGARGPGYPLVDAWTTLQYGGPADLWGMGTAALAEILSAIRAGTLGIVVECSEPDAALWETGVYVFVDWLEVDVEWAYAPPTEAPTLWGFPGNALVSVDWTEVTGATSYRLEWSPDQSSWSLWSDGLPLPDPAPYTVSPLVNGQGRWWRVAGENGAGRGPWSNVLWLVPGNSTPPEAPVLTSPRQGPSEVELAWTPSGGATLYRLRMRYVFSFVPDPWIQLADFGPSEFGAIKGDLYGWRMLEFQVGAIDQNYDPAYTAWSNILRVWLFHAYDPPGEVFQARKPIDEADAYYGRKCVRSGMWYPAHAIVDTPEGPTGIDWVRERPEE